VDASINGISQGDIKAAGGFFAGIIAAFMAAWMKFRKKPRRESEPKDTMQAMRIMVDIIREDRESAREERKLMRESLAEMSKSIAAMAANIQSREQRTEDLHREHGRALIEQRRHLEIIEVNQQSHLQSLKMITNIAQAIADLKTRRSAAISGDVAAHAINAVFIDP
jgi:uncharacterized membrane protein YccC